METKKPMYDIVICLCVLLFVGGFAVQTPGVPKDARGYPIFLMCASALLAVALLIRAARELPRARTAENGKGVWGGLLITVEYCLLMGIYVLLMDKISYVVSTLLFVVASLLFLRVKNWKLLVLLPLGLTFSMYFLFTKFLLVTLPRGIWFSIGL